MLTWGPFYYHSSDKSKERMESILDDIIKWCNMKDPSLNIIPENIVRTRDENQIIFDIKAWKDDETLQECDGIITNEEIFFEDTDE